MLIARLVPSVAVRTYEVLQVDAVTLEPQRCAGLGEVSPLRPALRERMVAQALVEAREGVLGSKQGPGERCPGQRIGDRVRH